MCRGFGVVCKKRLILRLGDQSFTVLPPGSYSIWVYFTLGSNMFERGIKFNHTRPLCNFV
jgi:hypothetical protein